ncbi:hypothetical protein AcV7_003146 [Taiwanofungus camphoratus]|nr:hypothetical protein AcV7_003146 [Antrodia cinnamomea]
MHNPNSWATGMRLPPSATSPPPEICDHILDHLWDDRAALEACSLTCPEWLPTTRFHLFHSICIRDAEQCTRLEKMLAGSLPTLVDVTFYIRHLTLMQPEFWPRSRKPKPWLGSRLPALFKRLKSIEYLELRNWQSEDAIQEGVADDLAAFFPRISTLRFHYVDFDKPEHLLSLLVAYPSLSSVHVFGQSDYHNPPVGVHRGVPTKLVDETIKLDELSLIDAGSTLSCLMQASFKLRPRKLHLGWLDEDYSLVEGLLVAVGTSLEHLQISTGGLCLSDCEEIDLHMSRFARHHSNLTFTLEISSSYDAIRCSNMARMIRETLIKLRSILPDDRFEVVCNNRRWGYAVPFDDRWTE